MRLVSLGEFERKLARCAAVVIIGSAAAGCSSGVMRFGGVDDVFTGSTPNQRNIIKPVSQPFPGDVAPLDASPTGSVNRGALEPVTASAAGVPIAARAGTATLEPVSRKPLGATGLDTTSTGSVAPAAGLSAPSLPSDTTDPAGWSRAGGTQVTAREGETVYNLSRRFGVPANVIAKVNGLPENGALKAGQKLVIPTYVYSAKAPVSAPDNNPNVADARSSRGTKYDVPADKVPTPSSPGERLAVLPTGPKVRESEKPETATPAVASAAGTYKVQDGDTLSGIARKTGAKAADIKAANGLKDGMIRVGQSLKIPAGGATVVAAAAPQGVDPTITGTAGPAKPAKSAEVAGYTPPKKSTEKVIEQASNEEAPDATGIGRMRWPVKGRVVSGFRAGNGKANDGIDIAVPEGTPVKAAENGVVIYAGDGLKEFGNTVLVRHENGLVTVYGHASELKVQRGQKVKRGEDIALSGMSGSADAPKLHFEVRKDSAPVDPSGYLP